MWLQAIGVAFIASLAGYPWALAGSTLLGVGTAMAYPALLAAIGDVTHPSMRASTIGIYRLWRDLGYAFGAILSGLLADAFSLETAVIAVAALTAVSGAIVKIRMTETLHRAFT